MQSIYLSALNPRWLPTTEQDLELALAEGLLEETHYLELKRELEPGKGNNKEHARDLAQFAIDGGTLLIGVEEHTTTRDLRLAPQPLSGLRERVEAIARSIPDPPLSVVVRSIPAQAGPTIGYLVIHIPASPAAPHMVDKRYIGRGDTAKYYLSDAEVLRLHEGRRQQDRDALELLRQEFARDPIPLDQRRRAHLFLLAEPLNPRPEMLLHKLHHQEMFRLVSEGAWSDGTVRALGPSELFSPELSAATQFSRRSSGAALSTPSLASDRSVDMTGYAPEDIVEFEISEDGAVRIMMGRLSDSVGKTQVLFDAAAVIYVRRLLGIALAIAEEAGYFGGWALAVGATGIRGLAANEMHAFRAQFFEDDTYERATVASYADLVSHPGTISHQLLGRFLRKLGTHPRYTQHLSDPPPETAPDDSETDRGV